MTAITTDPRLPRNPPQAAHAALGDRAPAPRIPGRQIALLSLAILALLAGWVTLFPYTADGDAALHYLNARDTWHSFEAGLYPWARPAFKLFLMLPAMGGMFTARMAVGVLSVVAAWQTIRLAEDLKLPRALLAGVLLIAQPFVFALAADTMTELPMALGIVIALRLWINGWFTLSALVVGILPAVRPEGFFLGVIWGLLVLFTPRMGPWAVSWPKRARVLLAMSLGLLAWSAAGWWIRGDPLLIIHGWSWPPESYPGYGHGPIYHYAVAWPYYCGLPLAILFLRGIPRSLTRAMALPWAVWGIVFGVHSVLFWGGWFASCGLIRILACTAPVTAIVCLNGWNAMADSGGRKGHAAAVSRIGWPSAALAAVAIAWAMVQYCVESGHWDFVPLRNCTRYVRENNLLESGTCFFPGNRLSEVDLGLHGSTRIVGLPAVPEEVRRRLHAMPIGGIGIWDNRQAQQWHGMTIDELADEGFEVLHEERLAAWGADQFGRRFGSTPLRYAVLRKIGPGPVLRTGGLRGGPSQ